MRIAELINLRQNRKRLDNIRKNRRNTIPFVGAGISAGCGLYTWRKLLDILAVEYLTFKERKKFTDAGDYLEYAEAIVNASGNQDAVMRRIGEIFEETDICIGKAPYLLVSSFANNIVTTNYDLILESSAKKFGNKSELKVLLPCLTGQMTAAIQENQRCLLKIHGSVEETTSMVFSESQYNEFYSDGKPLPIFLETFFSGRSLLFIGCSLTKDRTIDVLAKCISRNPRIRHYAIVELPQDSDEEVKQKNYLTSIGIDPIYYPKGEYGAVELLLEYLAEDNSFIKEAKKILNEFISEDLNSNLVDDAYDILISMLNESYYNTAKDFPELLELSKDCIDIVRDYKAAIDATKKVSMSLYDICINMFNILSRSGIKSAHDIRECLINSFSDAALRETDIRSMLQKQHIVYVSNPLNIEGKSDKELTELADKLNRKIQFENEMGFRHFMDYYNQAIELLDTAYERIEMHQRVILCNTIGAWGTFVLDTEKPRKYLNLAISTIESLDEREQPYSLLSKCYCNLALLMARDENYIMAVKYAKKDLQYKLLIDENPRLYAGSMGHYALYQKECDPFSAIQTYIEVIRLKRNNIDDDINELRYERDKHVDIKNMKHKLMASWATGVFDFGLLAKDLTFYQLADDFIKLANEYRYEIIDKVSKDYNASCNVEVELDVLLYKDQDIQRYISAVDGRVNMNPELSTTIYHSWYICALFFYGHGNYNDAKHYIRKFYKDFYFQGDVIDTRQEVRAKLLEARILLKTNPNVRTAQSVLNEAINLLKKVYSSDSYWLIEPYTLNEKIDDRYSEDLNRLKEKYVIKREEAYVLLKKFFKEVNLTKPIMD